MMFPVTIFLLSCLTGSICSSSDTCIALDYADQSDVDDIPCKENEICRNMTKKGTSYLDVPPYSEHVMERADIKDIFKWCCGDCTDLPYSDIQPNGYRLTQNDLNNSDFVYPVLGWTTSTKIHGFYFLPFIHAPAIVYITEPVNINLLESIFKLYPIMIICLLFAIVSGFIAWLLETWANKDEFQRRFLRGWFDGFWWSIVSMTTVGYGDKTPKTVLARIFSVIWILIGIITFSLLSGKLTEKVVNAANPKPPSIDGSDVGVLLHRDYDEYVVSHKGGNITKNNPSEYISFCNDMLRLINRLHNREIQGMVLDKWTLNYVLKIFDDDVDATMTKNENEEEDEEEDKDDKNITCITENYVDASNASKPITKDDLIDFFLYATIYTEQSYKGEHLAYGMLAREEIDYKFFKDFAKLNQIRMSIKASQGWLDLKRKRIGKDRKIFSPPKFNLLATSHSYFRFTVITMGSIIGVIIIFGVVFESKQRFASRKDSVSS